MTRIAILICVALAGFAPAGARAQDCASLPRPVLQVRAPASAEVIEHTVPAEQIARLSGESGQPPHALMAMGYALDSQVAVVHRIVRGQAGYCDAPEIVAVSFGIARRDVFMVPEAAATPCIRDALLAHERDHARIIDREAHAFIERHRPQLMQALDQAARHAAPDNAAARTAFEAALFGLLRQLTVEFGDSMRGPLRAAGDNPAALSRLAGACNGVLGDMDEAIRSHGATL